MRFLAMIILIYLSAVSLAMGCEEKLPLEDKVANADVIALGWVTQVDLGRINLKTRTQLVNYTFSVRELIKGQCPGEVRFAANSTSYITIKVTPMPDGRLRRSAHSTYRTGGFSGGKADMGQWFIAYLRKDGSGNYHLVKESNQYFERLDEENLMIQALGEGLPSITRDGKLAEIRELVAGQEKLN